MRAPALPMLLLAAAGLLLFGCFWFVGLLLLPLLLLANLSPTAFSQVTVLTKRTLGFDFQYF